MSLVTDPSPMTESLAPAEPTALAARPTQSPAPVEAPGDRPYAVTADTFHAMIEAEVFPEEARVYLQDGRIYEKMAKTQPHSMTGGILVNSLVRRAPDGYLLLPEGQFRLDEWNNKLPDLALIRCDDPRGRVHSGEPLKAADIRLAIEIAVTSLAKDLGVNLERYARALIPNYWVVDVLGRRLFVHTDPQIIDGRGTYTKLDLVISGGAFTLLLEGQEAIPFAYEDLMA
ncbi:MAG: hypothetical protein JWN86_2041 [Planctomycetota bacterium]|nr:hypothetical protein [Planctomycetota bacterium]